MQQDQQTEAFHSFVADYLFTLPPYTLYHRTHPLFSVSTVDFVQCFLLQQVQEQLCLPIYPPCWQSEILEGKNGRLMRCSEEKEQRKGTEEMGQKAAVLEKQGRQRQGVASVGRLHEMTHPRLCSSLHLSPVLDQWAVLCIRKKGWSWQNISWAITAVCSLFVCPAQITRASPLLKQYSMQEHPESCSCGPPLPGWKRLRGEQGKSWSKRHPLENTMGSFDKETMLLYTTETALKHDSNLLPAPQLPAQFINTTILKCSWG